jgi:hypothetical protein
LSSVQVKDGGLRQVTDPFVGVTVIIDKPCPTYVVLVVDSIVVVDRSSSGAAAGGAVMKAGRSPDPDDSEDA